MKSRHLAAMETLHQRRTRRLFWIVALVLVGLAGAAFAQDEGDPPARVAHLSYRQGGVVFAPQGEQEWVELPRNRPLTSGDRLWTDRGARAELQLGSATLHVGSESHLGVSDLDDQRAQFILQQGTVNLRVRELLQGENVEVDTPNLALRALQPGDYRIDVDARTGQTRVTVQGGAVSVFGEGGEAIQLGAGQQSSFAGRYLAQVETAAFAQDDFGLWAAGRNRAEDASVAARYVPRGVIGATDLDQYGTWNQDPGYGAVWYPTVTAADWAPYRYGHWDWISPWGWTWVDDEPWGFAPFHYGRWTMIGTRWAWVPGRMVARPVYSPALVVFFGGGGTQLALSSGPGVGWYPLAPGEAWYPVYRSSPRYVSYANYSINLRAHPRHDMNHQWRTRPAGITAVTEEVFRRGNPVYRHWQPVAPQAIGHAQFNVVPVRPELRHRGEFQREHGLPRLQSMPSAPLPANAVRTTAAPRFFGGGQLPPAVADQARAQHEQQRLQWGAERAAREQQQAAERARQQQDARVQQEQVYRQQQEQAGRMQAQREATQRDAWRQQREQQRTQPAPLLQPPQGGHMRFESPAQAPQQVQQVQPQRQVQQPQGGHMRFESPAQAPQQVQQAQPQRQVQPPQGGHMRFESPAQAPQQVQQVQPQRQVPPPQGHMRFESPAQAPRQVQQVQQVQQPQQQQQPAPASVGRGGEHRGRGDGEGGGQGRWQQR